MRLLFCASLAACLVACSKDDSKNNPNADLAAPSFDGSANHDQAVAGDDLTSINNDNDGGSSTTCSSTPSCSIVLSGVASLAGTYPCTMETKLVWTSDKNQFGIAFISGSAPGNATPFLSFDVLEPGKPALGMITLGSANMTSSHLVMSNLTNNWEFTRNDGNTLGTSSLTLSCLNKTSTVSTGEVYASTGVLNATLDPVAGGTATGTITAVVTFNVPGAP